MRDNLHHRKSSRLPDYDYSMEGYYFVSVCTQNKKCILGEIVNGKMILNNSGELVNQWWMQLSKRYENITLDSYQIMPNHIHGIVIITQSNPIVGTHHDASLRQSLRQGRTKKGEKRALLPVCIGYFKMNTSKRSGFTLWQQRYYEHVIRNDADLMRIREYIFNNPLQWDLDQENPKNNWLSNPSAIMKK